MKKARYKRPLHYYGRPAKNKPIEIEGKIGVAWGGHEGLTVNMHEGYYWGEENVLKTDLCGRAQGWRYTITSWDCTLGMSE